MKDTQVALEFVGGPLDGQIMAFRHRPHEWRVAFAEPISLRAQPDDLCMPVRIRQGVYRPGVVRREQVFRGGAQNNLWRYIVDVDVMRWEGEE